MGKFTFQSQENQMEIIVCSKRLAPLLNLAVPHVWIKITNPKIPHICVNNPFTEDLLELEFDDVISRESWEDCGYHESEGRDCVLFDEKMAHKVLDFYDKWKNKVDAFYIHCAAGVSRSAAIASWLAELEGIDNTKFMMPPKYPNVLVRNLLRRASYERQMRKDIV